MPSLVSCQAPVCTNASESNSLLCIEPGFRCEINFQQIMIYTQLASCSHSYQAVLISLSLTCKSRSVPLRKSVVPITLAIGHYHPLVYLDVEPSADLLDIATEDLSAGLVIQQF